MNNTIIKQGLMRTRECWFMGLCLFCVLLSSCRKDVEFKGEESDPRIVLNAFLFCGDTISFKVSKSVFFLESNFDASAPEGLNVKLFVNDMEISGLHVANDTMFTNSYLSASFFPATGCCRRGMLCASWPPPRDLRPWRR